MRSSRAARLVPWTREPSLRARLDAARERVRVSGWSIAQASVAAGVAYFLAIFLLGHERPFFAPVAAVVTLSITLGNRSRRAFEVGLGVAVGLLVADILVFLIGPGPAQLALVVVLAMAAAVLLGGGPLLVNQAAISALLVVAIEPPEGVFAFDRFFDAVVGASVALAVNYAFPASPARIVERAARPIFEELAAILEELAVCLERGDLARADAALDRARKLDVRVEGFTEALTAGRDTARLSPAYRRTIAHLELYAVAGARIDLTTINGRILARGAANAVRHGDALPEAMPLALRQLAEAVRALSAYLKGSEGPERARGCALEAAARASALVASRRSLAISMLVGQTRSAAIDVLRSTGMDQLAAVEALEQAAGRATDIGAA
jgi:uncharacterized membrane protein YgaE (UPF0421/DUF939 family)